MADPAQGWGTTPIPDPTKLTQESVERSEKATKSYIDGEVALAAAEVRHAKELVQAAIVADARYNDAAVAHLREVDDIRFQAAERLAGRESELNALALAAAFAAQKEASAKEAEYTARAGTKAESSFSAALDKLGELFATQNQGLADTVADIKERVARIESQKQGAVEQHATTVDSRQSVYSTALVIIAIIGSVMAVIAFLATRGA